MNNIQHNTLKLVILISLIISLSITSHIICFYLIYLGSIPIIPSTITYMLVLALMDYLAVNFNRKIVFGTIVMESLSNAILLTTLKIIIFFSSFNHHTSLTVIEDLVNKFGSMYVANLIGSMIAFVINFFIFSYLYKAKSFLTSSILSSLIMLLIYTPITDLIAFKDLPIVNIIEIIGTNIISNIIFFIFWSAILSTQIKKEMQYA